MAKGGGVPVVITSEQLAELAVRLGSQNIYDRQGKVIFYDDFSNGINAWTPHTGNSIQWSAARSLSGGYSCLLPITAAVLSSTMIRYDTFIWEEEGVGLEVAWTWDNQALRFEPAIAYAVGGVRYIAAVRFTGGGAITPQIIVYAFGGQSVTLTGVYDFSAFAGTPFYRAKLVVDLHTKRYVSLRCNDLTWDLSAYALTRQAETTTYPFSWTMMQVGSAATAGNCYLGCVIQTIGEPV